MLTDLCGNTTESALSKSALFRGCGVNLWPITLEEWQAKLGNEEGIAVQAFLQMAYAGVVNKRGLRIAYYESVEERVRYEEARVQKAKRGRKSEVVEPGEVGEKTSTL